MGLKERRAREKLKRKEEILNAARTLLLKEGLHHTSVNKISKKAELSIGSIYFYFKNKEEIFAALQQEGLEILYAHVLTATENITAPVEKLKKGALVYYQFSQEHKDYFDVINYFLSSPQIFFTNGLKKTIDSQGAKILKYIESVIYEGIRKEVFEENYPGNFAVFFWSSLHGLVQIQKLRGTIIESDNYLEFFEYSIDKLIDSIRRKT